MKFFIYSFAVFCQKVTGNMLNRLMLNIMKKVFMALAIAVSMFAMASCCCNNCKKGEAQEAAACEKCEKAESAACCGNCDSTKAAEEVAAEVATEVAPEAEK